jgi:DNA-binding IclR family transcriptional regulator
VSYNVKVIGKLFAVIERLAESGSELSLSAISAGTRIPKPTVFRILKSLEDAGYAFQNSDNLGYSLSPKFIELCRPRAEDARIAAFCRPAMNRLLDRFSETINLAVAEEDQVRFLQVMESPLPLRMSVRVGHCSPLFATALGKSIMAHRGAEEAEAMLKRFPFKRYTRNTLMTPSSIMKELETVRRTGYALDRQEYSDECVCVAAPVIFKDLPVKYAISVSMPTTRSTAEKIAEIGTDLARECARITRKGT